MKYLATAIIALLIGIQPVKAQDLWTDVDRLKTDFVSGGISNFDFRPGFLYVEKADAKYGGQFVIGYNMPKMGVPDFAPRFEPEIGLLYLNNSAFGFTGSMSLKADLHVLRVFAGGDSNSWFYTFTATPYGNAGVLQNISGTPLGSFTVPGNPPEIGQGTGAMTGYGVQLRLFKTGRNTVLAWVQRSTVTTIPGSIDGGGLSWVYSPKGW